MTESARREASAPENSAPAKKRRRGRPTKYRVEYADILPGLFEQGETVAEVAKVLGVDRNTFYHWVHTYPKFARAYEEGKFLSEAWWMSVGRLGAIGARPVQPAMWIFNVKNRFGWRDRPPDDELRDDEMTPEQFAREVTEALAEAEDLDSGDWWDRAEADSEMDPAPTTH